MIVLPEMNVESKGRKDTAHGIKPPNTDPTERRRQENIALKLNMFAKKSIQIKADKMRKLRTEMMPHNWSTDVLELIIDIFKDFHQMEVTDEEIINAASDVLGCDGLGDLAVFVADDHCTEVFVKFVKYVEREGQNERRPDDGFIDSDGIKFAKQFLTKLQPAMNKTMDAKYHFKDSRILQELKDEFGIDLSGVANAIHPGFWSYPQGHFTKAVVAYYVILKNYHVDAKCDRNLSIAKILFGIGRDANLIHRPQDCVEAEYMK